MVVQIERILFTADQYEKMIEAGILEEGDNVELLRGEIVKMAPIGLRHAGCVARLVSIFAAKLSASAIVWPQNPIRLADDTEPEPDVALLKPSPDFYTNRRPGPQDVLLLVEVADSSLEKDQSLKVPMYAQAGIAILWIVNLIEDVVEVYASPVNGVYTELHRAGRGETILLPLAQRLSVSIDEILG
ncbi:MAG TPA: Uma2 family endonuclease [Chloroflexia bacterium]|nr:Uma2 family endonuclease [Chloroflexia bacterium]